MAIPSPPVVSATPILWTRFLQQQRKPPAFFSEMAEAVHAAAALAVPGSTGTGSMQYKGAQQQQQQPHPASHGTSSASASSMTALSLQVGYEQGGYEGGRGVQKGGHHEEGGFERVVGPNNFLKKK